MSSSERAKLEPIELPWTRNFELLKTVFDATSNVMAMAVQKLFPQAQFTIASIMILMTLSLLLTRI